MESKKTFPAPNSNNEGGLVADVQPIYRYVPVNQFTPLSNANWFALTDINSGQTDSSNPWRFILQVGSTNRGTKASGAVYTVVVEMISHVQNIFRVRFDPSNPGGTPPDIVFGPVTQANLTAIRQKEISNGAPSSNIFSFSNNQLMFGTNDLAITIDKNFRMEVRNGDTVIHQDAQDSNQYSLGATFVDRNIGMAVATVKSNNQEDAKVQERFYGQGEVNVHVPSSSGDDTYTFNKNGLSMTNFNYDQITYKHTELSPYGYSLNSDIPNYFFPMYFSAPWIVVVGNQGQDDQYAYGVFLNNPSQSYTNTGDTFFGDEVGSKDKFYLGAQSGEIDYFFVGGGPESHWQAKYQVGNVVAGLSYLCSDPSQKLARHAAMPPKYVFGFFQGVYGATSVTKDAFKGFPDVGNPISFEEILDGYKDANIPLEGFAVDIDVQDTYKVFTINGRFCSKDSKGNPQPIFLWAREQGLVTQTNITCFVKDTEPNYAVYKSLVSGKHYTTNARADGDTFRTDHLLPSDAYHAKLSYSPNFGISAIFPDWGKNGVAQWWGTNYEEMFEAGLDFIWQDMTTPSAAAHLLKDPVMDSDSFKADEVAKANAAAPDPQATELATKFNWLSYHLQAQLTDPRFGDDKNRSFAETRNQHAYSLCSATYHEGILPPSDKRKFQRSYIIARGGQIGSQHFGGLWMGDNSTDWIYLKLMIPMITSMNMSGVSVVGADIGGFAGTESGESQPASPELLTRWVQAGFLLPWFRNHYDRWLKLDPSTSDDQNQWKPKEHGKPYQELCNKAYDVPVSTSDTTTYQDAMRTAIEMRYRWQEVLYTAAYRNTISGRQIINPMCNWPGDPKIDYYKNSYLSGQFLLGTDLAILAAPVTESGAASRQVYLPDGAPWFLFRPEDDDNDIYQYQEGGNTITQDASITTIPVYVRKGAKLPTRYTIDGSQKGINTYNENDPLVFDMFSVIGTGVGPVYGGEVYLDDGGITTDAEDDGRYGVLRVSEDVKAATKVFATFTLWYEQNAYVWGGPVYLRLRAVGTVTHVTVGGNAATSVEATNKYDFFKGSTTTANYWVDSTSKSLWICVPRPSSTDHTSVTVTCSDAIDRSVKKST